MAIRKKLRIAASYLAMALLFLVIALWLQSYYGAHAIVKIYGEKYIFRVTNYHGELVMLHHARYDLLDPAVSSVDEMHWILGIFEPKESPRTMGFYWERSAATAIGSPTVMVIPYWFLRLMSLALALLIRPAPRFQTSRRELIGVTILAGAMTFLAMWL